MAGGFGSIPRDILDALGKEKDMSLTPFLIEKKPISECKGVFLRARINNFVSEGRVGFHVDLSLLKRKSCAEDHEPGNGFRCKRQWFFDDMHEWGVDSALILPKGGFEHEAVYEIVCHPIDNEEYELHFKKVDE